MNRRRLLQRGAVGVAALTSTTLAGCTGDGDNETPAEDGGDDVASTEDNDAYNWETATVEVAGETTVNGVTCTEFSVIADSIDETQTICFVEDYPFAVSLLFEQNGTQLFEMTLTDQNRP